MWFNFINSKTLVIVSKNLFLYQIVLKGLQLYRLVLAMSG